MVSIIISPYYNYLNIWKSAMGVETKAFERLHLEP